jgi:transposase-like protein
VTKATRARYTHEFKLEAVRLVKGGQSMAVTAKILGIAEQTLHNWIKADKQGRLQGAEMWLRLLEHGVGFDKWSSAGLTSVQSCPRRRAGVACDERTTDAVGNSCSPLMLPV